MREELKYWLALSMIKGVNTPETLGFIHRTGDVKRIFAKGKSRGRSAEVAPAALMEKTGRFSEWGRVEKELSLCEKFGVRLIAILDESYPPLLREIYAPPILLYAKGNPDLSAPAISVVGTRRATEYGLRLSGAIAQELASAGVIVVSGMARGCDSSAHRGALRAGGKTVAVLGTGIEIAYPKENRALYEEISEKGLLLSEFPFSTPPLPMNFPIRNRIISGMSRAVVVVEAPEKSGAMMTAALALDCGRDVLAVPGRAGTKSSAGTNRLIREGASLVENAGDVLRAVFPELGCGKKPKTPPEDEENPLLTLLEEGPLHIDEIAQKCSVTVEAASAMLLEMELKGLIAQSPGKLFAKKHC
jgi:DNA processing protein